MKKSEKSLVRQKENQEKPVLWRLRDKCWEKEWPPVWNVTAGSTEAVRIWARQVQCGDGQKPARNGQMREWAGGGVKA